MRGLVYQRHPVSGSAMKDQFHSLERFSSQLLMRVCLPLVLGLLLTGCARHHAITYSTQATFNGERGGDLRELQVVVSRLNKQHGKVVEQVVAMPRFKLTPGVPAVAQHWMPGSLPFGTVPGDARIADEHVRVTVAWEGEDGRDPVCTVAVLLGETMVSKTTIVLNL